MDNFCLQNAPILPCTVTSYQYYDPSIVYIQGRIDEKMIVVWHLQVCHNVGMYSFFKVIFETTERKRVIIDRCSFLGLDKDPLVPNKEDVSKTQKRQIQKLTDRIISRYFNKLGMID